MSRLLVYCIVLLAPCFTFAQSDSDSSDTDILETVFRYQLTQCYRERAPKLFFLSYQDRNPTDALMYRFKHNAVSVKKRSQMRKFADVETGNGILLTIDNIEFANDGSATATGSCSAGPLDGHMYAYHVIRKNRKWFVTKVTVRGDA
jgi:hypothetical protein